MKYLLTPSLYNSLLWFYKKEDSDTQEIIKTLKREPIEQNEAMINGIKFEDDVLKRTLGTYFDDKDGASEYDLCVHEIAETVKGGLWQQKTYFDYSINGWNFLLYARADVVKRNFIYDIKFSKTYDIGKYSDSIQHLIECQGFGIDNFKYLISDGKSVFHEDYTYDQSHLIDRLNDFIRMIDAPTFKQLYLDNWKAKQ